MSTPLVEQVRERVQGSSWDDSASDRRVISTEHLQEARKLTPREKKSSVTRVLTERFLHQYKTGHGLVESKYKGAKAHKAWNQLGRMSESRLIREHDDGQFKINGPEGLNVGYMTDAIEYGLRKTFKKGDQLQEALSAGRKKRDVLKEHVVSGIGKSQYGRYMDNIIRIGTWELCGEASIAPVMGLIGNIQVDCGQQTIVSDLVPMDVWRELHPMAENEPTPFFGVDNPIETVLPERHKLKFAYAINREAYCMGLDAALRKIMVQGAVQLDKYWAPHIVQTVFGYYASTADNPWSFNLNGDKFANEYPTPAATFEHVFPYRNLIYNDADISRGDDAIFVLLEEMFREAKDLRTGNPSACVQGALDIIATGPQQVENVRAALAPVVLSMAQGGNPNTVAEQPRAGRGRWNVDGITEDIWIEKYAREFLDIMYPDTSGFDAAMRQSMLDRTLIVGNVKAAMVMQDEWNQEEFDMPTEWTNFDREVVWGRKFMSKSGLATPQPEARGVLRGWPTGGPALPAAPTAA